MKPSAPRFISWLLAIFLPIFAIYPALINAIEEHAYDAAGFHIFRGVVFSAARAEGSLYPRWVQSINGGLGGPLFEFYSPLPYFLMDLLNSVGIAHPVGWRILTALALLAASTGMFGLALALFRRADAALLSAAIFCYNSYLLRDLFERGSPQGWAIALLPWLLWLVLRAHEKPTGWRVALAGICFAAIILIHNATALLLTPLVAIFILFLILRDKKRALAPIAGLIAGLLLAAFYLIPYVAEIQFVQFDNPLFAGYTLPAANPLRLEDFLTLPRIFDTGLGNNAIGEGGGLFHAFALLLAIPVGFQLARQRRTPEMLLIIGNWLLAVFVIWLQTDSATFVWNAIPALSVFQFRWRLLSVMGFVSALIVGYVFSQAATERAQGEQIAGRAQSAMLRMQISHPQFDFVVIPLLITFYVLLSLPSLYPDLLFRYIQFAPRPIVADAQAFALKSDAVGLTSFNEYLPRWRQLPITNYAVSPLSNLPSDAKLLADSRRNGLVQSKIETPQAFTAAMNVLYYPGWVGYVDGQSARIRPSERAGLIAIDVPSGAHTIELRYEGTIAQHIGDWISILAAVVLAIISVLVLFPSSIKGFRDVGCSSERRVDVGQVANLPNEASKEIASSHGSTSLRAAHHAPRNDMGTPQSIAYLAPRWWLPAFILLFAAFKAYWVDPQTTLFRSTSICDAIQDSVAQTNIVFDDRIRLCGYALSRSEFQPGDQIRMTLYWQIESPATEKDFSFVHLLGDKFNPETNNPLWGQQDKVTPGEHSITDWAPNKMYRDVYAFRIAPHATGGEYQLEIGWQDANGKRLQPKMLTGNDRLAVSHLDSLLISGIRIR